MVDLRQGRCQLAGARSRCGDHHEVAGDLGVFILAKAFFGDNDISIGGITGNRAVFRNLETQPAQALNYCDCLFIAFFKLGHHNVFDQKSALAEDINQAQHIIFVQDA